MLGCRVIPVELVDPYCYHLDTCFAPLHGGFLLYYPEAFDAASRAEIEKVYPALSSQFVLLMLATSVISAIGVDELTSFAGHIQTTNFRSIEVYTVCIVIYLALTLLLRSGARALGVVLFSHRRRARPVHAG